MGFVFPLMYTLWTICKHLHRLHKQEICVLEMFMTFVLKIPNPFIIKCQVAPLEKNIGLSNIIIKAWPKLLIQYIQKNLSTNLV